MEPEWELSKENVVPLARGRSKESLRTALHATDREIEASRQAHVEAVQQALAGNGPHAHDPLAPATSFVKWAADAYSPKARPLLAALEHACHAFVDDQRYVNDPRFVRLWVRYADARDEPLECFNFMRAHGIGDKSALFYEAWATTLEYKKDFPAANIAYEEGMKNKAEPEARLDQRRKEFLARMVARDRRAEARAAKEKRSGKPSSRSSRNAPEGAGSENIRPALGALSMRQAASSRRPLALANDAENKPPPRSHTGSRGRVGVPSKGNNSGNSDTSFKVFSDPAPQPAPNGVAELPRLIPESGLRDLSLANVDDEAKENEGDLPSQWAGVTIPQSSPLARARGRSRPAAPTFEIFHDDDNTESLPGGSKHPVSHSHKGAPPAHHDAVVGVNSERESRPSGALSGPPSPTINTKMAMKEVEDMFNSPLPFERESAKKRRAAPVEPPHVPKAKSREKTIEDWCVDCIADLQGFHIMETFSTDPRVGAVITLQDAANPGQRFVVENKLGDGHQMESFVYSVAGVDNSTFLSADGDNDDDDASMAMKVSQSVFLAWEFYIYKTIHIRFAGTALRCVPQAVSFFNASPLSYLLIDRVGMASLAQIVEAGYSLNEHIAMFLFVELLKGLEAVHSVGIIHADVTLANILLRKDDTGPWSGAYNALGRDGWSGKGVALVDFNHAVDTRHSAVPDSSAEGIASHAAFLGHEHLSDSYKRRPAGRQCGAASDEIMSRPWGFNMDCWAASMCARKLLRLPDGDIPDTLQYAPEWRSALGRLERLSGDALSATTISKMQESRSELECVLTKVTILRAQLKKLYIMASELCQSGDVTRG